MPFGLWTRVGARKPCIRWGPDLPCERAVLRRKGRDHCKVYGFSAVSCAKTAELIDMPFGVWTQVSPRKHVFDIVHIGTTWQMQLNHPCAVAMRRPFVKLL